MVPAVTEENDGFLAVGGQHLARGIPEAICLGSDRPHFQGQTLDPGRWAGEGVKDRCKDEGKTSNLKKCRCGVNSQQGREGRSQRPEVGYRAECGLRD